VELSADPATLAASGDVELTITIRNTGQAPVVITGIEGLPTIVQCDAPHDVVDIEELFSLDTIAPGGILTMTLGCVRVECPDGAIFTVTAITAEAYSNGTGFCVFDEDGNRVSVRSETECRATVICEVDDFGGCTPGFWRNCTYHWAAAGYPNGNVLKVSEVFDFDPCVSANIRNATLHQAIQFGGGGGIDGAARNLLRAAVASLLNAASPLVNFPMTEQAVIGAVNEALQSCDRQTMLALASELDELNNAGCIDQTTGEEIPCMPRERLF
jgi:hypothetical protein